MTMPTKEALKSGVLMEISKVTVDVKERLEFKRGVAFDPEDKTRNLGHAIVALTQKQMQKTAEWLCSFICQ